MTGVVERDSGGENKVEKLGEVDRETGQREVNRVGQRGM